MKIQFPCALASRLLPVGADWWAFFLPRLDHRTANDNRINAASQGGR